MTTATKLTLARIALIPAFLIILYWGFPKAEWVALAVFILASLTDTLDGYVARKYDQVSTVGKFLDPLADKILVCARGLVIAAAWSGKVKTFATMVCICFLLVFDAPWLSVLCQIVIIGTTVWSGVEYFLKNKAVFRA